MIIFLNQPDNVTAERMAQALRDAFRVAAKALDPGRVRTAIPDNFKDDRIAFAARVESLPVEPDEAPRVVINEATGAVVAGKNVKLLPASIVHGGLTVEIGSVTEAGLREASVSSLVSMLDRVGAKPRDVVTIFKMLKRVGALQADLLVL
jgi:flagellar P-ring protein precursor FlgI